MFARRLSSRQTGAALALAAMVLSGCAAGPDYVRPSLPVSAAAMASFKEGDAWRPAQPGIADAHTPWRMLFGDRQLDALVAQANLANQSLQQAEANYRQAQALVQAASAAYYPTIGIGAQAGRARSLSSGSYGENTSHGWSLQAAWKPDLWGGVRRSVEAAHASEQASEADLAAARLAVQAAVVNDYIQLRLTDVQKELYARTLEGYRKSLSLTEAQHRAGVVTGSDVALAQNTLAAAEAQATDVELSRRQLEHALAVLVGRAPADFSLAPASLAAALPAVPAGLPSQLLERRPDIAGAERRAAAANAQIGVARAAWFPNLTLSASGGNTATGLGPWLSAPTRVWSLGLALAGVLFDGGLRQAHTEQARAAFDAAAAAYRQTVLAAMQEVEDNLAALHELGLERAAQERAVKAAEDSVRILMAQYRGGTTNYLSVITAQALALTAERTALQLQSREFAANVALVKALGGGWPALPVPGSL